MNYSEMRAITKSGDTIACKRRAWISVLIRIFTAESINHSAVLLRQSHGLWVTELREGQGFLITPASQWVDHMHRKGVEIFWCEAPDGTDRDAMRKAIMQTRAVNPDYSYWTLVKVWWSQVRRKHFDGGLVCSTYAAAIHKAGGYDGYKALPDPGDILLHANRVERIR